MKKRSELFKRIVLRSSYMASQVILALSRFLIVPLAIGTISSAHAMDFGMIKMVGSKDALDVTISATGQIDVGDDERLHRFVASLPADTRVVGIVLDSPGGRVSEAMILASTIRASKLNVAVDGRCASACFLMFMAGVNRYIYPDSNVGVHSANTGGKDDDLAKAATVTMARRAGELGASPQVLGKMLLTPPTGIYWLTEDDLLSMGVRFVSRNSINYVPGQALQVGTTPPIQTPLDPTPNY